MHELAPLLPESVVRFDVCMNAVLIKFKSVHTNLSFDKTPRGNEFSVVICKYNAFL